MKKPEIDFDDYDVEDCYESKNKKTNGTHFMRLETDFLWNGNLLKENASKFLLYLFLRSRIRTIRADYDVLEIYKKYYHEQGLLATSWPMDTLAKIFDVSKGTINNWLNELINSGAIRKEKIATDYVGRGQYQNVYILGELITVDKISYYKFSYTGAKLLAI